MSHQNIEKYLLSKQIREFYTGASSGMGAGVRISRGALHPAPCSTGDQEVSQHSKGTSHLLPHLLGGSKGWA